MPADGEICHGRDEDEVLHPLDIAPYPHRPAREPFSEEVIAADLDRLAALQQDDGGWVVDFLKISPGRVARLAGLRPRLSAIDVLRRNGRV